MEFFKKTLFKAISFIKFKKNQQNDSVIYKIIDKKKDDTYILQCINSKSIFEANILEIVFDSDILHGLHPLQSCFIGIEYAFDPGTAYRNKKNAIRMDAYINKITSFSKFKLKYINRKGLICYVDTTTNEEEIMYPKEAIFIDSIIKEFHPGESFYIGFCAGKQINIKNNVYYINQNENNIKIKNVI